MSHATDEKSIKTAKINLPASRHTRIGGIVAAVIAAFALMVILSAKVSWNSSSAQSNTPVAPAQPTIPTCVNGQPACTPVPSAPAVVVDLDTDSDGILDSVDQCVNMKEDIDGVEDDDGCPELTDGERIAILEKEMKGQKGQWDAISALKGRMTTAEKKIEALQAWQQTVNSGLKVAATKRRVEQVNEVYVINGKVASAAQYQEALKNQRVNQ